MSINVSIQGLKALLGCLEGHVRNRKSLEDVEAHIKAALGTTTVEDEESSRKRQTILDKVEAARVEHKAQREACWRRPEGETEESEFLAAYSHARPLDETHVSIARMNAAKFAEINGIVPAIAKTSRPIVLIINLTEAVFDMHLDERNPKVRQCFGEVENCVKDIARSCFFYSDLRPFEQPHVLYYRDDDDGDRLEGYNFRDDDLAAFARGRPRSDQVKFYRERSYRYRESALRYENFQTVKGISSFLTLI